MENIKNKNIANKNKKKHILQVCRLTPLWGTDLFREITHAFKLENTEVTTVFLSGKAQPELKFQYYGEVIFLEINRHVTFWRLSAFFKLLFLCRKTQFDLILCHHYKPTLIMHFVSFFIKTTRFYSMHHNFGNFRKKIPQLFLQWLKNKWYFITVSAGLKKEILSFNVPDNRIIVIHNTADIEKLRQQQFSHETARKKLGLSPEDFIVGTLGRLVTDKGHTILIDAFYNSSLIKEHSIKLVIIGTGPLESALKDQAKKYNLEDRILFVTDCAHEGAHYLKAFDVFVFPSLHEAFGIALLEAACAELPIIASSAGGIPEAVGNHGFLVPPSDTDALKTAMEKYFILTQEERKILGAQGLKYIQENFSLEKYYQNIQKLIKP